MKVSILTQEGLTRAAFGRQALWQKTFTPPPKKSLEAEIFRSQSPK
ncbi:MAG: hypothetical protein LBF22_13140 [Deltaproteobacteria bacterium]|nr:hypothetical protein [Deltaproteobacteria bacterium]